MVLTGVNRQKFCSDTTFTILFHLKSRPDTSLIPRILVKEGINFWGALRLLVKQPAISPLDWLRLSSILPYFLHVFESTF